MSCPVGHTSFSWTPINTIPIGHTAYSSRPKHPINDKKRSNTVQWKLPLEEVFDVETMHSEHRRFLHALYIKSLPRNERTFQHDPLPQRPRSRLHRCERRENETLSGQTTKRVEIVATGEQRAVFVVKEETQAFELIGRVKAKLRLKGKTSYVLEDGSKKEIEAVDPKDGATAVVLYLVKKDNADDA